MEDLNEKVIRFGMFNEDFDRERALKEDLKEVLAREDIFWRDKSREVWLKDGDSNSKFFHTLINTRRIVNKIEEVVRMNGDKDASISDVGQEAMVYFINILGSNNVNCGLDVELCLFLTSF